MNLRHWALAVFCLTAVTEFSSSRAGVWIMDPVVGLLGDFSSNPALLDGTRRSTAVTSGAAQLDAPTVYHGDRLQIAVLPSFRGGDSHGYSSVTSNFERLNLKGEYDTDRSVLSATAGVSRDSSLAYDYLTSNSTGVRRDAVTADLNYDHHLTELFEYDVDASIQRVRFGQSAGVNPFSLINYEYSSASPTLVWNPSERDKYTLSASGAHYNSDDARDQFGLPQSTESRSLSAQLGFTRQLTELWTLSVTGGYSRALNEDDYNRYQYVLVSIAPPQVALEAIPTAAKSAQNGSLYSVGLSHKGTLLVLNATASRLLAPTGFAFLSRQDNYELNAAYNLSERWSFSGDVHVVRYQNPPISGTTAEVTTEYFNFAANWHWTEHWTLSLGASRVSETVHDNPYNAHSNEVTLTVSRQFNPITFWY